MAAKQITLTISENLLKKLNIDNKKFGTKSGISMTIQKYMLYVLENCDPNKKEDKK